MKLKESIKLELLVHYGYETSDNFNGLEKYHVRDLNNGSWSIIISNNRDIFIASYRFFNNENSCTTKIIDNLKIVKKYIKDLLEDNLIEGIFIPPDGQLMIAKNGKIIEKTGIKNHKNYLDKKI